MSGATETKPEVKVKTLNELERDHGFRMGWIAGMAISVDRLMTHAFQSAAEDLGPTKAQEILDAARTLAQEKMR